MVQEHGGTIFPRAAAPQFSDGGSSLRTKKVTLSQGTSVETSRPWQHPQNICKAICWFCPSLCCIPSLSTLTYWRNSSTGCTEKNKIKNTIISWIIKKKSSQNNLVAPKHVHTFSCSCVQSYIFKKNDKTLNEKRRISLQDWYEHRISSLVRNAAIWPSVASQSQDKGSFCSLLTHLQSRW